MRRFLGAVAAAAVVLSFALPAPAQTSVQPIAFSLSASAPNSPVFPINTGLSTCAVVVQNVASSPTIVPQVSSDSQASIAAGSAQWSTASGVGSGSITTFGQYVGNVAGVGLTAFRLLLTSGGSSTATGTIFCSTALAASSGSGGTQNVTGTGTAGTPATGVVSVQGISGGTPANVTPSAITGSGTMSTSGSTVVVGTAGYNEVSFTVTGTWTGTIIWSGSSDGSTYPWNPTCYNTNPTGVSNVTFNQTINCLLNAATQDFKLSYSSYTSGTANISYTATNGPVVGFTSGGAPIFAFGSAYYNAINPGIVQMTAVETYAHNAGSANGSATYDGLTKDVETAGPLWVTTGGGTTTSLPAAAGNVVIKNAAGRLAKAIVTTTGTSGDVKCYDNASTNSGTIIADIAGAATSGTVIDFSVPAANGITCVSSTTSPVVTLVWW